MVLFFRLAFLSTTHSPARSGKIWWGTSMGNMVEATRKGIIPVRTQPTPIACDV